MPPSIDVKEEKAHRGIDCDVFITVRSENGVITSIMKPFILPDKINLLWLNFE